MFCIGGWVGLRVGKGRESYFSHLVAGRGFSPGRARDAAPDLSGASGILVVTGPCRGHSSSLTPICPFLLRSECRVDVHPSRNCVCQALGITPRSPQRKRSLVFFCLKCTQTSRGQTFLSNGLRFSNVVVASEDCK